jgi:Flp pilus assembly protein TadG
MRHTYTYRGKHHPATGRRAAGRRTTLLTPRGQRTGAPAACPGQGLVEFALVVPLFLLLVFAIIDFGILFEHRITLDNAARNGARWATTHPTAWSNAATAPSNTIEGQVQIAGGTSAIPNSDSNIVITYLVPGSGTATVCGHYSASSGSFVAASGYTQATCVTAGHLVQVRVTHTYHMISPIIGALFRNGITETASATMVEEQ